MSDLGFSVCIPTYNGAKLLPEAIASVLRQDFDNFELLVVDNCSLDDTSDVVSGFHDPRIRYFRNERNLGLGKNLQRCAELSRRDLLYFLCHDDILLGGALRKTHKAFLDEEVSLVTRPYYWFEEDVNVPNRVILPPDRHKDRTLGIFDGEEAFHAIFSSVGQLSGLAFRRRDLQTRFREDIFTPHIFPFAEVLRTRKVVFLRDFTVAVRTGSSMTRSNPEIYNKSPTQQWIEMFETVFAGPEFASVCAQGIDFICGTNYEGLVQIAATSSRRLTAREIRILATRRPRNMLNPKFWLYGIGTLAVPPHLLRILADQYKTRILSRRVQAAIQGEGAGARS